MSNVPNTPQSEAFAPSFRRGAMLLCLVLGAGALAPAVGCRKTAPSSTGPGGANSVGDPLPPLFVRAPGDGLTFSFITTDGGFQLVKRVDDVPYEARDAVRVWSELSGDGIAGPWVYVADLRTALPDGSYKVEVMKREAFEKLASERRGHKPAGSAAPPPAIGGPGKAPKGPDGPKVPAGAASVVLYGAEWCKPCHVAEAYMKKRGIPYVHKDIDDPNVNEEMRDKLAAAGLKSGSIPVFDVAGKILVGFSEDSLDAAWAAATKK